MISQARTLFRPILFTLLATLSGSLGRAELNLRILNDDTISHYAAQLPELRSEDFAFVLSPGFDSDKEAGSLWFVSNKAIYALDGFPKKLVSRLEYARLDNPKLSKGRILELMDYQRNILLQVNVGGLRRVTKWAGSYQTEALHPMKRLSKTEQQEFGKVVFDFVVDAIATAKRPNPVAKPAAETATVKGPEGDDSVARLAKLKKLHEQGLITKEQYDAAVRDELRK